MNINATFEEGIFASVTCVIDIASCRGIITADVLAKGLSRGAIATGLLEGVKADTKTRGFYTSSAPSMKVKAYV